MNPQDSKYQQKLKSIASPEQNYFAHFAMRYPVLENNLALIIEKEWGDKLQVKVGQVGPARFTCRSSWKSAKRVLHYDRKFQTLSENYEAFLPFQSDSNKQNFFHFQLQNDFYRRIDRYYTYTQIQDEKSKASSFSDNILLFFGHSSLLVIML